MIRLPGDRQFGHEYSTQELTHLMTSIQAVIYARVSTQDQARHGYSLESQIARSRELLKTKYNIADEFVLAVVEQGEMGDDPNRPALNQALWLVEQGIGNKFVVLHPDRLARDLKLQLFITERIWNAGCDIVFVEMDVDPNNPESLLLYNIQGAIAQYNKAKILANSKRGRRAKVMNGKIPGVRRVYGYSFDKTNDTLVVNEVERDVYLMMVDWLLRGKDGRPMTLTSVARELSLLGIPAPNGDKWYQATVSRIVKNPVYTGTFYYGKTECRQRAGRKEIVKKPVHEWQTVPVPAYIDEKTFDELQERIALLGRRNRGAKPKASYLLKGLARCGRCGAAVVAGAPSRDKQTGEPIYRYYTCSGKGRKIFEVGTGRQVHRCSGRNWRQDVVDDYVWRYVSECLWHAQDALKQIFGQRSEAVRLTELQTRRQRLVAALAEKREERKRWLQLAAKGRIDDSELDEALGPLKRDLADLSAQLRQLEQELASLTAAGRPERVEAAIASFRRFLHDGIAESEKKQLVDALIRKVVLRDDVIEIYTAWSGVVPSASRSKNANAGQGDGGL
ncbi:recombinase family protein [Alicyclobacillus fastidiosus]|uniref:Recombinase family protein n=1 Tax=Alicyclobacillus fastidiosus TaxID=392011 RepID=A0ABV5AIR5_9BACL